jgi:hypothetical protein
MVNVADTGEPPGVTLSGDRDVTQPPGVPLKLKDTGESNDPNRGSTVTLKLAD